MSGFAPGSTVNERYKVVSLLGQGGMATVYRVRDVQRNEDVALKILNPDQLLETRRIDRFIKEFEILEKVQHQSIVRVFDKGATESSVPFFTMELLQGKSLTAYVTEQHKLANKGIRVLDAVSILIGVAEALEYLHEHGIIYCDLNSANIMLSGGSDLERLQIKLIDFGISRREESQDASDLKSNVGTPTHMSPEQNRKERLDCRADIYSFGVLAYQLFTGELPFTQPTPHGLAIMHRLGRLPSPRSFNRAVPRVLDRLARRCMEKERKDRFDSVSDIRQRLDRVKGSLDEL